MKKKSTLQFKDEYSCVGCGVFGLAKNAKSFVVDGKSILLCNTCYRLRTNPTSSDIMALLVNSKQLIETRHRFLWYQQIKRNKHNTSSIGSPATASIKAVGEIMDAVITGLLLHDKLCPAKKKPHSK